LDSVGTLWLVQTTAVSSLAKSRCGKCERRLATCRDFLGKALLPKEFQPKPDVQKTLQQISWEVIDISRRVRQFPVFGIHVIVEQRKDIWSLSRDKLVFEATD
jgi:hypothetical protein